MLLEAEKARRRGRSRGLRDERQQRQENRNEPHLPYPRAAALTLGIIAKRPHSFQIVKISHFGTENVDDHVVGVDQHPVGGRQPLDPDDPAKSLLDLVGKLNRHRRDLPGRAPGGDHHMVGDVRLAGERDGHDLLRLIVVERLKDEIVEVFDVDGLAAAAPAASQRDVRSRGLLANRGTAETPGTRVRGGDRRYQLGSCARMAVAEVGSGGRRRKRSPVHSTPSSASAWLEGWTNRCSQPIARAAWAAKS